MGHWVDPWTILIELSKTIHTRKGESGMAAKY